MTWLQRYRLRQYRYNSIWLAPLFGLVAAQVCFRLLFALDERFALETSLAPAGVQSLLGTLAGSLFALVVFVCSSLLVIFQLASAQLTPRIIGFVLRDVTTKSALTLFVFMFVFSLMLLVRITTAAPWFTTQFAAYGFMASLIVFLFLIDHLSKLLRPSEALWAVASKGRAVIQEVHPRSLADSPPVSAESADNRTFELTATIANDKDGVVLAFDIQGLLAMARSADCVIEMVPQVGDFVVAGDPLFRIFGGREVPPARLLCYSVAVGQERTLEQDPRFAFRIMVDIASKALSPAINDPTTAVLAIDQIHHLLRGVGFRHLDDGRVRDATGSERLRFRTPDWEDYVHLAVTEIRHFGGSSIQIARRLRAMLENLIQTLPEARAALLHQELELLHRSAERFFTEPEDRALAEVSDSQGVGGKPGRSRPPATGQAEISLQGIAKAIPPDRQE